MMTTILSRARTYHFAARDAAGTALVVERVFRSSEPAPSVESFLAARRPFPPSTARERAEAFLGAAFAARADPSGSALRSRPSPAGPRWSRATPLRLKGPGGAPGGDEGLRPEGRALRLELLRLPRRPLRPRSAPPPRGRHGRRAARLRRAGGRPRPRAASSDYETLNRSPASWPSRSCTRSRSAKPERPESSREAETESMRRFVERALAKLPRLNEDQMRSLLYALAEENGRMDAALDSMLDGIVVCDREHLPIIYNKSAERMLRFAGADPAERPLWHSRLGRGPLRVLPRDARRRGDRARPRVRPRDQGRAPGSSRSR